ncbi:unnamed protein product, partial [Ixodes persulcatus]
MAIFFTLRGPIGRALENQPLESPMRLGIFGAFVTSLVPDGKGYGVNVVVTSVATWWRVDDLQPVTTWPFEMCKGCTHAAPRQVGNHGTTDKTSSEAGFSKRTYDEKSAYDKFERKPVFSKRKCRNFCAGYD